MLFFSMYDLVTSSPICMTCPAFVCRRARLTAVFLLFQSHRPEQSVMQALENLSPSQVRPATAPVSRRGPADAAPVPVTRA